MDNEGINTEENKEIRFSKKKIAIFFLILLIVIGIIAVVINLKSNNEPHIVYRTYNDPGKYFSIQFPQNWSASRNMAQGTTGIGTPQEATQNIEDTELVLSPDTGIAIEVYEGVPTCPLDQKLNTTLAGFPAAYDDSSSTWTIPTTKALVTVTISYPGSSRVHHNLQQTVPTPVPSEVAEQNKQNIEEILKTLKLTNLTLFNCQ